VGFWVGEEAEVADAPSGSKSGSTYGIPALMPLTTSPMVGETSCAAFTPGLFDGDEVLADSFLSVDSKVLRTRSKCSSSFALGGC
jgi:hypothetical protein